MPIFAKARWRAVEMRAWRLVGLIPLMLRRPFFGDCFISFIFGDPIDASILNTDDHILLRIHRMNYIHTLVRPCRFVKSSVTLDAASIPRWALSRRIESAISPGDSEDNVLGSNQALRRCAYWRRSIASGKGEFVEHLLHFTGKSVGVRRIVLRMLRRALMYVSCRDHPLSCDLWDVDRGEDPARSTREIVDACH